MEPVYCYILILVVLVFIFGVVLCCCCRPKICESHVSEKLHPSQIRNNLRRLQREIETKRMNYQRTLNQKKVYKRRVKELNEEIQIKQIKLSSSQKLKTDAYKLFTKLLLNQMRHYLFEILTVTFSTPDTNQETYKTFGMLLSGCQIKHDIPQSWSEIIIKVIQNNSFEKESVIVEKSVSLSRTMLTLLPPLLVSQPPHYDEEMHDVCRKTWNETRNNLTLYYYRPVLFYGKSYKVAEKGKVGNSKVELSEED